MNIMSDEQGFLHIYLMGMFAIGCVIIFAMLLATIAGARNNAVATYSWFIEASDFTTNEAVMSGITSANYQTASEVETFFENSFSGMTQTSFSGNEFTPAAGSSFPGPITLTDFTPYSQGSGLPNGAIAGADGFWISIKAPVLAVVFPFAGLESLNVPMAYYAIL